MRLTLARFERYLWYLFLFAIPLQTRIVLWQADVVFSEWRSSSLWFTDILILVLFALAGWQIVRRRAYRVRLDHIDWLLFLFVGVAALSLFRAPLFSVGIYQFVRLVQYVIFFLYLRYWAFRRFDPDESVLIFVLGAILQACIALGQSVLQHDLGIRWLGETLLTPAMHGVAVFYDTPVHKLLRAYGTLPHPNVLAAVLAFALWGLGWLWIRHGGFGSEKREAKKEKRKKKNEMMLFLPWLLSATLLLWAFGLTYARTVAAVWIVGTLVLFSILFFPRTRPWLNERLLRKRMISAVTLCAVVGVCFGGMYWPQIHARLSIHGDDEAVRLRLDYARDALASGGGGGILSRVNWIGVGIGNFTSWLAEREPSLPEYLRQPAHSVYLLVYAETGLLGIVTFVMFLGAVIRRAWQARKDQPFLRFTLLLFLAAALLIAVWDHFFWTLQQGRILWWGILALVVGSRNTQKD